MYDIFDGNRVLNKTVSTTITVPEIRYTLEKNQQVECLLVYSTLELEIPYTFTAALLFDWDGVASLVIGAEGVCS